MRFLPVFLDLQSGVVLLVLGYVFSWRRDVT